MSRWSTGAVGPNHRAVMKDGVVLAVAESTEVASEIVRRMNEPFGPAFDRVGELAKELATLKTRLRVLLAEVGPKGDQEDGWSAHAVSRIREALSGEPQ